ncbi:hypothetical protein L2E82_16419 [Cichorium intybus]|uniref:Uncharacterized protein n=1 Tax=Cichorium intybus TaxID=13427 RepID=A0ACB9F560_CICIN|nr:hypothetical protein L2E82_16419 [Cichorium intybus]
MVASTVASPLCTWLVSTCMSVSGEKNQHRPNPSPAQFSSSRRLRRSARRKLQAVTECNKFSGGCALMSSLCVSGNTNLMSSLESCEEYHKSKPLSSSLSIFGSQNDFSIFGFKNSSTYSMNQNKNRIDRAAQTGKIMANAVNPSKEPTTKKKPITKKRRVVVTGLGVVSPVGHDADVFYDNLLEGVSGISEIEAFNCDQFPTKIAGEIKSFSPDDWVSPKLSKRVDKFTLYSITAGKKALEDGGVTSVVMREFDLTKCGIIIGSALGGMKVIVKNFNEDKIQRRISESGFEMLEKLKGQEVVMEPKKLEDLDLTHAHVSTANDD